MLLTSHEGGLFFFSIYQGAISLALPFSKESLHKQIFLKDVDALKEENIK